MKACAYPFFQLKPHVALDTVNRWTEKHSCDMRKSLRMVPVNLRNEIKRLARTIALCSWGLSPGLEEQIQDIVAYRRALVEALIQTYDHVDSSMAVTFLFFYYRTTWANDCPALRTSSGCANGSSNH
jgi:hypothetical protein